MPGEGARQVTVPGAQSDPNTIVMQNYTAHAHLSYQTSPTATFLPASHYGNEDTGNYYEFI